ncbi:MAG: transposase [Armatimonadota bacterium]|nr:transposase [Armatimonadota bacterium]
MEENTADPDALLHALGALRGRFYVHRVVFVCDRGMVGKRTITALQEAGYDYIVGVRLRRIPHIQRDVLGRAGRYHRVKDTLYVKQVFYTGQRYIVCLNPEEAQAEAQEREAILTHLEETLRKGGLRGLIGNKGYRKYLRIQGGTAIVDRAKVEEEARCDGKLVLSTSTDLPPEEVALVYKRLWVLEQHFRTLKSPLALRPIYHWTDRRIRGHVAVCFFALVLRVVSEQTLLRKGINTPIREVLQALNRDTAIELQLGR